MEKKKNRPLRQRFKTTTIVSVTVITVIAIVLLLWLIVWKYDLEGIGYLSDIQDAVDTTCPQLEIDVTLSGYSGDPNPSWYSPGVHCSLDYSGNWTCSC